MRAALPALAAGMVVFLIACAAPVPTPSPTAPQTLTPEPTTPPPAAPQRLVIWLPDWMWQENDAATGELAKTISAFETAHGLQVDVVRKAPAGDTGLLGFLTSSAAVAPAVLPDVVVLSLPDAEKAAKAGLLQPLDGLLSADLLGDLFPFAQDTARTDTAWFAVPFAAWFEHLAFRPAALTDPPVSWEVVETSSGSYAFPAAGPEPALTDALLVHYLSSVPPGEDPVRNEGALRRILSFYDRTRAANRIDPHTLDAAGPAETFPLIVKGQAVMAHVGTSAWLAEGEHTPGLRFGPIPTADGVPRTIARGWALGVVTGDPQRQALAASLIEQLMAPDRLASWSRAAHLLPARRTAFAGWPASSYVAFGRESLEGAILPPSWLDDAAFTSSLHRAMLDILAGKSDVETAARKAAASW